MFEGTGTTIPISNEDLSITESQNFYRLYNTYSKELKKFVQRYVHSDSIAEDIVHDLYAKIWEHRGSMAHVQNLEAYLFRMAKNKTLDYLRKIKRIELMPDELIKEFGNYNEGVDQFILEKEYFAFLKEEFDKLPETSKQVFHLCREMGKTYQEVSSELNISKNTVKHHMVATVKRLKKEVLEKLGIYDGLKVLVFIFLDRFLP